MHACANHLPGAIHDATRQSAIRSAAAVTGATVVDPRFWVCAVRTGICPVVVADTVVYRDESHLSEAYAAALAVLADSWAASSVHPERTGPLKPFNRRSGTCGAAPKHALAGSSARKSRTLIDLRAPTFTAVNRFIVSTSGAQ